MYQLKNLERETREEAHTFADSHLCFDCDGTLVVKFLRGTFYLCCGACGGHNFADPPREADLNAFVHRYEERAQGEGRQVTFAEAKAEALRQCKRLVDPPWHILNREAMAVLPQSPVVIERRGVSLGFQEVQERVELAFAGFDDGKDLPANLLRQLTYSYLLVAVDPLTRLIVPIKNVHRDQQTRTILSVAWSLFKTTDLYRIQADRHPQFKGYGDYIWLNEDERLAMGFDPSWLVVKRSAYRYDRPDAFWGYGAWNPKRVIRGEDRGNSPQNMAMKQATRNALREAFPEMVMEHDEVEGEVEVEGTLSEVPPPALGEGHQGGSGARMAEVGGPADLFPPDTASSGPEEPVLSPSLHTPARPAGNDLLVEHYRQQILHSTMLATLQVVAQSIHDDDNLDPFQHGELETLIRDRAGEISARGGPSTR